MSRLTGEEEGREEGKKGEREDRRKDGIEEEMVGSGGRLKVITEPVARGDGKEVSKGVKGPGIAP